MRYKLLLLY